MLENKELAGQTSTGTVDAVTTPGGVRANSCDGRTKMRRLYLTAAVFAVACGAPPTGVETEAAGSDTSLLARMGPKTSARQPKGPKSDEQEDVVMIDLPLSANSHS